MERTMNAGRATKAMAVSIILAAGVAACDDTPAMPPIAPPMPASQPADEPQPARPTTRALLDGPRKTLVLDILPLSVKVPESWQLDRIAGLAVLTGPAPSGDVTIKLNTRTIATSSIESTARGAREEQKKNPRSVLLAESRTLNGIPIFERQSVAIAPLDDGTPTYSWMISAYEPSVGEESVVHEISFIGLSRGRYEADKDFLYSIINSMERTTSTP
jgi:hypothetical protein